MTASVRFADSVHSFSELIEAVEVQVDSKRRLPDWPFKRPAGFILIYEYDRLLGSDFGAVLKTLVVKYDDNAVTVVGFDPLPSYYRNEYSFFPGFQVTSANVADGYGEGLRYEPDGDPTGAMAYTLDIVAIAGASGSWSVWGQRDWEIGLLLIRDPPGAWLSAEVPWYDHDIALDDIRSPAGWGTPLSDGAVATFWRNLRKRGRSLGS